MSWFDIALYIHLLGVITLFIAFGISQRAGARARAAGSVEELRTWMGFLQPTGRMYPSAFVMILVPGLYMAGDHWSFDTPWVVVALVSVVVMFLVGTFVTGRSMREIGQAAGKAEPGPLTPELKALIERPPMWTAMSGSNAAALGILWLMVAKPDWVASIAVVLVLAVIGSVAGAAFGKRA
jgi:uncharacterized membrane protein